ncbi:MAG: hypothetical protein ACRD0M_08175, partial [Acidimicrobiales bacterium]
LRVRSIDFLRRTVKIDEQRLRSAGDDDEFGPPKSEAGERTLAAPASLLGLIADHLGRLGLGVATPDALLSPPRRVAPSTTPHGAAGSGARLPPRRASAGSSGCG